MLESVNIDAMGYALAEAQRGAVHAALNEIAPGEPQLAARIDAAFARVPATDIARDALDRFVVSHARDRVRDDFADSPLLAADLRQSMARVLLAIGQYPSAVSELQQVLEKLPEHTDTVTVYRTLNTFTEKKVVHRVQGEDRAWRYAISTADAGKHTPHGHPHFVCDTCGTMECLEDSQVPTNLVKALKVSPDYEVQYPEVVLHGVCPRCQA